MNLLLVSPLTYPNPCPVGVIFFMIGRIIHIHNYPNRDFKILDKIFKDTKDYYLCVECGFDNHHILVVLVDPEKILICDKQDNT